LEAFIFELGNIANKVEVLRKEDSIEIRPKGYLGKKNWREINETLLRNGFEWLSSGKHSCWVKMKTWAQNPIISKIQTHDNSRHIFVGASIMQETLVWIIYQHVL
jgi:hypothetical protein